MHLLDHAWSDLTGYELDAIPVARVTCGIGASSLAPRPIASGANYIPREREFHQFAIIQMLQCNGDRVNKIFSLLWTRRLASSSASEKSRKDVMSVAHTATTATLHGLLASLIIQLPFRFIGKNFIGLGNFLELQFKFNSASGTYNGLLVL